MDPRTKDAIRAIPGALAGLKLEIDKLVEGQKTMKKDIRSVKDAVVREYKKE